jgi:HAD superfamily hydrolase (TIGR01490 family)
MSRELALFDFDGTLTTKDTMFVFLRHVVGPVRLLLGLWLLSPVLVAMKLGLVENAKAKGMLLKLLLGGRSREALEAAARSFVPVVDPLIRPAGREKLRWHQAEGHEVRIVSASLDLWVGPWAEANGVKLLATPTAWRDGRFAGLGGTNCNHDEKVRRVDADLDRSAFDVVHAYGDTSGDKPMLAIAQHTHFRPFRDG